MLIRCDESTGSWCRFLQMGRERKCVVDVDVVGVLVTVVGTPEAVVLGKATGDA
jgi:hypothetical protein